MKVIAFQSEHKIIVSMEVKELINLAGFKEGDKFNELVGSKVTIYSDGIHWDNMKKFIGVEIPITSIFYDARETLQTYESLKNKLESVRNQLTTLTKKMTPKEEEDV